MGSALAVATAAADDDPASTHVLDLPSYLLSSANMSIRIMCIRTSKQSEYEQTTSELSEWTFTDTITRQ